MRMDFLSTSQKCWYVRCVCVCGLDHKFAEVFHGKVLHTVEGFSYKSLYKSEKIFNKNLTNFDIGSHSVFTEKVKDEPRKEEMGSTVFQLAVVIVVVQILVIIFHTSYIHDYSWPKSNNFLKALFKHSFRFEVIPFNQR